MDLAWQNHSIPGRPRTKSHIFDSTAQYRVRMKMPRLPVYNLQWSLRKVMPLQFERLFLVRLINLWKSTSRKDRIEGVWSLKNEIAAFLTQACSETLLYFSIMKALADSVRGWFGHVCLTLFTQKARRDTTLLFLYYFLYLTWKATFSSYTSSGCYGLYDN